MGIKDKINKYFNVDESEYFDDVKTQDIDVYEPDHSPEARRAARNAETPRPEHRTSSTSSSGKVVDIHTTAKLQVVLKKPEHFDEASSIADELLDKRTVVLNLEFTNRDEAGKLLCFLSGVTYANGGQLKKIANNTYIITPYNVDVMGDLIDELENNGMFFV